MGGEHGVTRTWIPLSAVGLSDLEEVGGKAARLGALAAAGFPVPAGFVLPPRTCGHQDAAKALDGALEALGGGRVAVRSSGLAEDLEEASFAGQYETVLGVEGPQEVMEAVRRCCASASTEQVRTYSEQRAEGRVGAVAVLVQRLVDADAAGVAYSANPITGDRAEAVVSAVLGLGERLVSGEADPDEWVVRGRQAVNRRHAEGAIDRDQALAIADLARNAADHFGTPQDIEWAIAGGELHLLQSRPLTALPEAVSWEPGVPGGYVRNFRLGEWLGEPVTPLFESWLLTWIERRLHDLLRGWISLPWPDPPHIVLNGWYYYSADLVPGRRLVLLRLLLTRLIPGFLSRPRRAVLLIPPLAHLGLDLFLREWHDELLPRHKALVEQAASKVERDEPGQLVEVIDQLATDAGDCFASITAVGGCAWKVEVLLAGFYRKHLHPRIGGAYTELLQGLYAADGFTSGHSVQSLDWFRPTLSEIGLRPEPPSAAAERRQRLAASRQAVEARARAALAGRPRLLARFERLLARAQRLQPLREEQVFYLTLGWPVMRRALQRIGTRLTELGVIAQPGEVFFLRRAELVRGLTGDRAARAAEAEGRRATWERQKKLAAPLVVGQISPLLAWLMARFERSVRAPGGDGTGLCGVPASPGRSHGPARVIRNLEDAGRFQAGDVLIAPATTPAWTPLFARAAAVVTDTGGVGAHASQVAREYGIPAVVGTGDSTARLRDGQLVSVDGGTGEVRVLS